MIYSHERNRDGDYALGDLAAIRQNAFTVARDFEGFTNRDINGTTVNLRGSGERIAIDATTGFVKWNTEDATDLDYTPLPLATRNNAGRGFSVHAGDPIRVARECADGGAGQPDAEMAGRRQRSSRRTTISWRSTRSPRSCCRRRFRLRSTMTSPESAIDSTGIGVFGQGTLTFNEKADLTLGLRFDHETQRGHAEHVCHAGVHARPTPWSPKIRSRTCRRNSRSAIA